MQPIARTEEHVGEWKLSVWADTLEELFAEAARVISRQCGPTRGEPGGWEQLELSARDPATLLVDWLNELLGRSEVNGRAYDAVRNLRLQDGRLEAEIRGKPVTSWRSPLKAATYHGLELKQEQQRWKAGVLFDV